jgi:hypothetical protein
MPYDHLPDSLDGVSIILYHTIRSPRLLHHLLRVGATKSDIPNQKQ